MKRADLERALIPYCAAAAASSPDGGFIVPQNRVAKRFATGALQVREAMNRFVANGVIVIRSRGESGSRTATVYEFPARLQRAAEDDRYSSRPRFAGSAAAPINPLVTGGRTNPRPKPEQNP